MAICSCSALGQQLIISCCCSQVVKGPVTKHLPVGAERLGFSRTQDLAKIPGFVDELRWQAGTPVFVLGAMAHGQLDITYVDRWGLTATVAQSCIARQGLHQALWTSCGGRLDHLCFQEPWHTASWMLRM